MAKKKVKFRTKKKLKLKNKATSKKTKNLVIKKKLVKAKKIKTSKPTPKASIKKTKPVLKTKVFKKAKSRVAPKERSGEGELDLAKKIKIRVVGIGGGGGNIVAELSRKLKDFSSQKIDFVAANTDSQSLKSLNKNIKVFAFGQKLTRGLGTGRDVELGERAAREDVEKIKEIFSEDRDLFIIISSLGGGTGTGAAPIFVKAANDFGSPVLGIFTTPFSFEGKKKMDDSKVALERMKENLNAYMILPNEKIFGLAKEEISFTDSLNLLNSHLANSLDGLLRAIYSPGLINIDWADIRTVLEGKRKTAYLNVVKGKINQNLDEFIKSIFKNPILDCQFNNADSVLFNIDGSRELSLQTLAQISEKINELAPNAKIIFGLNQNSKMKNEIKVTILATVHNEQRGIFKINKNKQVLVKKEKPLPVIKKNEPGKKNSNNSFLDKSTRLEKKNEIKTKEQEDEKEEIEETRPDIRRNALEAKEAERQAIEKEEENEKIFEIPAFLRKNKKNK